ncbi:MAG: hypothetical protein AAFP98_08245 [Pseudomonadota bacterium]
MSSIQHYSNVGAFLQQGRQALATGPIALIMLEDDVEVAATLRHHASLGFRSLVVFGSDDIAVPEDIDAPLHWVRHDMTTDAALETAVNGVIAAAPGRWLYYCYNAEFLHFPFCEDRTVGEMLTFHAEERRSAMLTYVVDLYADDLLAHPSAVDLDTAHFDTTGYYALARWNGRDYEERQFDFFGGLRWRFEEHIPWTRRRIDRIGLFRAAKGLTLKPDHTFNVTEYNTYACPWHNNLTAAICSFRTAKALKRNPGSRTAISNFRWSGSTRFNWTSTQLMDHGLMEPGQWF